MPFFFFFLSTSYRPGIQEEILPNGDTEGPEIPTPRGLEYNGAQAMLTE